jgi:DNA-binding MarR family transcriptional regulator
MTQNDDLEKRVDRIVSIMPKIMKSIAMSRVHSDDDARYDLTFNQYQALTRIHQYGQCSVNELAESLRIAQSTTSQLVDRLVKANLVSREIHTEDRRRMIVMLSKRGEEMMIKRKESIRNNYKHILEMLDEKDQRIFEDGFVNFLRIAEKIEMKQKEKGAQ